VVRKMGMGNRCGLTAQNTMEIGRMIKQMVTENCSMQMVMFMKVNGNVIKRTDKGLISMPMELLIKGNGRMTNSMVKELKHGQMEQGMMECI